MKRCFKCGIEKPLTGFYAHKEMADGHLNKCKICTKKDVAKHRSENIEVIREYDRSRGSLPHRIELRIKTARAWREKHPDRRRANNALNNAVRDGIVTPWSVCSIPDCNGKPEAHHPDYSRPLDVVWLCRQHHQQAHAIIAHIKFEAEANHG